MTWPNYGLGRRHAPDLRDAAFSMRQLQPRETWFTRLRQQHFQSKFWEAGPVLNQGDKPYCVGYSWAGFLMAEPTKTTDGPTPQQIYDLAQQHDEWEGPPPAYDGSSVRGGAKALQLMGRLSAYHWALSVDDIQRYVLTRGTVVMGTAWFMDMFRPDRDGYLHPTGEYAGGHAWLIIGYSWSKRAFLMQNSWGTGWGQNGRAWIKKTDLATLFAHNGEACAGIEA